MFAVTLVLALSSTVSALLISDPANDGRGATIFPEPSYNGVPFPIPANQHCTDLDRVYADFNDKTRSIRTEKGYRCLFYLENNCPKNGSYYPIGSIYESVSVDTLSADFDNAISSIWCSFIVGDTPAIKDPSNCEHTPGTA